MIRNVVLGRLRDASGEQDRRAVAEALAGIMALDLPGLSSPTSGLDAGLRAGGWDFAIVNDFADAEAYRRYDADEEHNRHRSTLVGLSAEVARVQFDLG